MAEDNDLESMLPKDKLMCFEKMNQFSGISKASCAQQRLRLSGMVCGVSGMSKQGQSQSVIMSFQLQIKSSAETEHCIFF